MTQLMMWKRNGKRESGVLAVSDKSVYSVQPGGLICLLKSTVTDLQEAKVVPLDAIVISDENWRRINELYNDNRDSYEWAKGVGKVIELLVNNAPDFNTSKDRPIVISKELWKRFSNEWTSNLYTYDWKQCAKSLSRYILVENPHLVTPEPMKEPTNFAAVVEAHCAKDGNRQKWVLTAQELWMAESGWQGNWSNLINPVLISEGVVGK